jgi:glucose-1-phosphate thymidylyltransferase
MGLGYLIMGVPYGVPFTLDQAYPFVQDAVVALGFPDLLFHPDDAYSRILERLASGDADVILGVFPTEHPHKAGMVDLDAVGRVIRVVEKPRQSKLRTMWAIAVWEPAFSEFMHRHLRHLQSSSDLSKGPEIPIGDVIQAAILEGMRVEAEVFPGGAYLDIGTPEDLMRAGHWLSSLGA